MKWFGFCKFFFKKVDSVVPKHLSHQHLHFPVTNSRLNISWSYHPGRSPMRRHFVLEGLRIVVLTWISNVFKLFSLFCGWSNRQAPVTGPVEVWTVYLINFDPLANTFRNLHCVSSVMFDISVRGQVRCFLRGSRTTIARSVANHGHISDPWQFWSLEVPHRRRAWLVPDNGQVGGAGGSNFLSLPRLHGLPNQQGLELTVDRIDLAEKSIVFKSLKKRRDGVFRAVPMPDHVLEAIDLVHAVSMEQFLICWSH